MKLTAANLSKRAKSSLSSLTSSWALQDDDSWVKPTMSANKMLHYKKRHKQDNTLVHHAAVVVVFKHHPSNTFLLIRN